MARLISILILWTCFSGHFCFSQDKISIGVINPEKNRLKPTYQILQEGLDISGRDKITRSLQDEITEDCNCIPAKKTDVHTFRVNPSREKCKYTFGRVTQEMNQILKEGYEVSEYGLDEWSIQFFFYLTPQSKSTFRIYPDAKDSDLFFFISWEMRLDQTTGVYCGNENGITGDINNPNDFNKIPVDKYVYGLNHVVIEKTGNKIYLHKVGSDNARQTSLQAVRITNGTKFGFMSESRDRYQISEFFLESDRIKFFEDETNEEDNNPGHYSKNENIVSFLSIANNDYMGKTDHLKDIPINESKELNEMYLGREFNVLESIHNFESKGDLKKELDKLSKKIKAENTNILFVHYGGHGAVSSSEHDNIRAEKHHMLIPTKFDDLVEKYGRKQNNVLFDHVPRTDWFIGYLQDILSKCGKRNEYKLLFVTIDACRNYQGRKRSTTSTQQFQGIHSINKIENVYTIVRYSVPDGNTANNYNSYTKKFLKAMDSRTAKYFVEETFKDVNLVKADAKYQDTYFGPNGPIEGDSEKDMLKAFRLKKKFTEFISDY